MTSLTHRQRLETTLAGNHPDRPPVALWRHFPVDDQRADTLAAATVAFQRTYDFDFVKITPASSFCLRGWGAQDQWRGSTEGTREYTHRVIQTPEDWYTLKPQSPNQGALATQLEAIHLIRSALPADTPIIQTIFSPLAQAKNLAGGERLLAHIRQAPDAVRAGLQTITESITRFIEAALPLGLDGVFYAVQHAQAHLLSLDEFQVFGRVFDLQALQPARALWLNVLHLHGSNVFFDALTDYPVAILNWHDLETPPSLKDARTRFAGAVCGGLRQWDSLALGTVEQVQREAEAALTATDGTRFVLGTGCVTPIIAPHGNLMAARRAVETWHG
ncbi:MAG: hypothetical protein OHK0052_04830 [Anaerolineales bacterium]